MHNDRMNELQTYIEELEKAGLTQTQISEGVKLHSGRDCNQSSISRLKAGITTNPSYVFAAALKKLHESVVHKG